MTRTARQETAQVTKSNGTRQEKLRKGTEPTDLLFPRFAGLVDCARPLCSVFATVTTDDVCSGLGIPASAYAVISVVAFP